MIGKLKTRIINVRCIWIPKAITKTCQMVSLCVTHPEFAHDIRDIDTESDAKICWMCKAVAEGIATDNAEIDADEIAKDAETLEGEKG